MGGVYPTVCPEHVIEDDNVDIAIMGHAEERLDKLLYLIEDKDIEGIKKFDGIAYKKPGPAKEKVILPLKHDFTSFWQIK